MAFSSWNSTIRIGPAAASITIRVIDLYMLQNQQFVDMYYLRYAKYTHFQVYSNGVHDYVPMDSVAYNL